MPDLLVKLYELPPLERASVSERDDGALIRLAMPYERPKIVAWVHAHFGEGWAAECDAAFGNRPISCFIATHDGRILGFACYDCTCRDYFGPVGVDAGARRRGIGKALLSAALHAMASAGYAYAIIGGVSDIEFYRKAVGAIEIAGSSPGIYRDRLD